MPQEAATTITGEGSNAEQAAAIICPGCQQPVPREAAFCAYCCGHDGRRGATTRGAFLGGTFGLLAGGLLTAVWSSWVGAEQTAWSTALTILLAVAAAGVVVGVIVSRRA